MRHFIKIPHICKLLCRKYSESESSAESAHAAVTEAYGSRVLSLDGCAVLIGRNPVGHYHYGTQSFLVHDEDLYVVDNGMAGNSRIDNGAVSIDGE